MAGHSASKTRKRAFARPSTSCLLRQTKKNVDARDKRGRDKSNISAAYEALTLTQDQRPASPTATRSACDDVSTAAGGWRQQTPQGWHSAAARRSAPRYTGPATGSCRRR